ncbi:ABC-2 transporter permease [Amphibacillus sp. Q70]|uniref:ABC-2 transporter permease n=1 Tax=Amphibacillus sp. Q70 TaxID=3453416 RepID=UPI003F866162
MNKLYRFIKLDFLTIKPYLTLKNMLIVIGMSAFLSYVNQSAVGSISIVLLFTTIYISYPFAVGDQNGIDSLYIMLGIEKKSVVTGRYLWALLMNLIGLFLSIILTVGLSLLFKISINLLEVALTLSAIFMLFTLMQAFQLSMFFKLGYMKAKTMAYLPMLLMGAIFVGITVLGRSLSTIFIFIQNHWLFVIMLLVIIWLAAIFGSYAYSVKQYTLREI